MRFISRPSRRDFLRVGIPAGTCAAFEFRTDHFDTDAALFTYLSPPPITLLEIDFEIPHFANGVALPLGLRALYFTRCLHALHPPAFSTRVWTPPHQLN